VRGAVPVGTILSNTNDPGFYVRFFSPFAALDPGRWKLDIRGMLDAPTTMTLDQIGSNLLFAEQSTRMKCVEGWSSRVVWGGFRYDALAALVKPRPEAAYVHFLCDDTYEEVLPVSELRKEHALFATHMDGRPLGAKHGAPLRMVLPWLYGYKGAKTIIAIEFSATGGAGTWSQIGPYSVDGVIQPGMDIPLDLDGKPRPVKGGEVTDY
jgi:sulfoxide reductase catalytic subunit YedY